MSLRKTFDRTKGKGTVLLKKCPKLHLTPRRRKPYGKQSRFILESVDYYSTVSPPHNVSRSLQAREINMQEITVNEFKKKAEALITEWKSAEKVCPICGHKSPSIARFCVFCGASLGLDLVRVLDPSTILSAFHYIPYILATIHYAMEVRKKYKIYKAEKDIKEKVNLWLDESIDRILQLALNDNVDEESCKNNMKEVVEIFIKEVETKNMTSVSDIISNKMYNVLKKYYPDAGSKERELIDYIVRAELIRLKD